MLVSLLILEQRVQLSIYFQLLQPVKSTYSFKLVVESSGEDFIRIMDGFIEKR
jgi:hypothetical protein